MINEVKRAIFKLREIIDYDKKHRIVTIYDEEQIEFRNNIELVVDLVEKLQKENEELKSKVAKRNNELIELEETSEKEFLTRQEVKENYIPKDLVIKKIQEQNNKIIAYSECFGYEEANQCNYCRIILEELLEEGK